MNITVHELRGMFGQLWPLTVRPEVAKSMGLHEGDTVTPEVARDIRTACHYYTMGSTAQILNQLNDLQRGRGGQGLVTQDASQPGLGDLPVAASHSRAASTLTGSVQNADGQSTPAVMPEDAGLMVKDEQGMRNPPVGTP